MPEPGAIVNLIPPVRAGSIFRLRAVAPAEPLRPTPRRQQSPPFRGRLESADSEFGAVDRLERGRRGFGQGGGAGYR